MKYMGSKSRIKKQIVPILQRIIDVNNIETYVEPFCGGCNVIDDIVCKTRIANDKSEPLIELLKAVIQGIELPDDVSKELYTDVKINKETSKYDKWFVGAIGFLASYNGKYFGGHAGKVKTKIGTIRNYYDEAKRNLEKQSEKLKGIEFICNDYKNIEIKEKSLIYCDIPYSNTTGYHTSNNFDYVEFWEWVKVYSKSNIVIVSEETAPNEFKCIWKQVITRTQDNSSRIIAEEKLFMFNPISGFIYE